MNYIKNMQKLNLIQKIRAKTPRKNKIRGQIMTAIGTLSTVLLTVGDFQNKWITITLICVAVLSGGIAAKDATKYKK